MFAEGELSERVWPRERLTSYAVAMDEELKQVWAASAAVESLQGEMDQAQTLLDTVIDEAAKAGALPDAIGTAANLTAEELNERLETPPVETI